MPQESLPQYPARPPFFAMKIIRLLAKVCAAQEIGPTGFALISVIATTEDAAGYRRPVTFFDGQLMPIVGVDSQKSLASARRRCVEAGWLAYEPGGKSRAARYFVTIPGHADGLDDYPSDEGEEDARQMPRKIYVETVVERETQRESKGNATGTILPIPIPNTDSCSEPPKAEASEPIVMTFPTVGKTKSWILTQSKVDEYSEAYPDLDIDGECRKARQWVIDNPSKRKTASGMTRFLNSWLAKAQNSGSARDGPNQHRHARPSTAPRIQPISELRTNAAGVFIP